MRAALLLTLALCACAGSEAPPAPSLADWNSLKAAGTPDRRDRNGASWYGSRKPERGVYYTELTGVVALGRNLQAEVSVTILSGAVRARVGRDELDMGPGQSLRVPAGRFYRLLRKGAEPAVLAEVYEPDATARELFEDPGGL